MERFADNLGPKDERARWRCACSCGTAVVVTGKRLRSGNTRSCGCLRREASRRRVVDLAVRNRKHGLSRSAEYKSWLSMLARCLDRRHVAYHRYGGRGVRVCPRWRGKDGLTNFVKDMGHRPSPRHTLDRFPDRDGDYEPGNCRWATKQEQMRNTRSNRLLTLGENTRPLAEWAEVTGIKRTTITQRICRGWSVERALTERV